MYVFTHSSVIIGIKLTISLTRKLRMISVKTLSGKKIFCMILNINIFNATNGIMDRRKAKDTEDDMVKQSS